MTYVSWPGEIADINANTTMTLPGQAGGGNRNFIPSSTVGERPPVRPDGGSSVDMADWFDKYWQSQVAMHTSANRNVFFSPFVAPWSKLPAACLECCTRTSR